MEEEWRPVAGYEGLYEVSSEGRVRGVSRLDSKWRAIPTREKSNKVGAVGHPVTNLYKAGRGRTFTVHTLVAVAFIGERPSGFDVAHEDGDRTNNSVRNLRYKSRKDNLLDAVRHGTNWQTAKTHCPRGHMYSGSNLKVSSSDRGRDCRACTQERTSAHHAGRSFYKNKADAVYYKRLKENGETHE